MEPLRELRLLLDKLFLERCFFELERLRLRLWPLAEAGALLLADLTRRSSAISAIISFIRMFLRLLSVASTSSWAMLSMLLENYRTRLLNYETPPFVDANLPPALDAMPSAALPCDVCSLACK